jgi:transposase
MNSATAPESVATDIASPTAWGGCDVGDDTFDAGLWFPLAEGRQREMKDVPVETFPRTPEGVAAFLVWADALIDRHAAAGGPRCLLRVVMEATGSYSLQLSVWMLAARPSLAPAIINPKKARKYIDSLGMRNKTDRGDARGLSRYGAERCPVAYEPLTPEQAELRSLSRYRHSVIEMRVAEENRLRDPIESPWVRKTIEKRIKALRKEEKALEEEMKKVLAKASDLKRDCDLIDTVYGVGFITAVTVIAELGDLRRFMRARQLTAFSGLTTRMEHSGTSVHRPGHLCKFGSDWVRRALYMPAMVAIGGDTDLAAFYKALIARGKSKMSALGAVMRKMLVVMRAVVISGKPYEKHHVSACGKVGEKGGPKQQKVA